jgi:uracil-DNA glycosylase
MVEYLNNIKSIDIISKFIDDNFMNKILERRNHYLVNHNLNIFPSNDKLFKCFEYFHLNETKVVILGQDPYHTPNQATGLAFGINESFVKQPSLKNIEKELISDLNVKLEDQTLEKWAKQNVLLLNCALTVVEKKPGSDLLLWNNFTNEIINYLNNNCENIIFVAWGAFSHKKLKAINLDKHKLIISSHPSSLSCYKIYKDYPSFIGSKPFSKINEFLKLYNKEPINW